MNKNNFTLFTILALALTIFGCGGAKPSTTNNSNAAKPGNTASNTANSNSAKKDDKPKTELKNEKKPEGQAKTASKKVPVPTNWIYIYDDQKGYGFSVPEGSTGGSDTIEGIDLFVASTPAPAEVGIYVLSYKDKKLTKDDLLDHAVKFLEGMG